MMGGQEISPEEQLQSSSSYRWIKLLSDSERMMDRLSKQNMDEISEPQPEIVSQSQISEKDKSDCSVSTKYAELEKVKQLIADAQARKSALADSIESSNESIQKQLKNIKVMETEIEKLKLEKELESVQLQRIHLLVARLAGGSKILEQNVREMKAIVETVKKDYADVKYNQEIYIAELESKVASKERSLEDLLRTEEQLHWDVDMSEYTYQVSENTANAINRFCETSAKLADEEDKNMKYRQTMNNTLECVKGTNVIGTELLSYLKEIKTSGH